LLKKKEELKKQFDAEYDEAKESGSNENWFEAMKEQLQQQAKLNQMEFANLDPETRYQLEGYKPGTYVRYLFSYFSSKTQTYIPSVCLSLVRLFLCFCYSMITSIIIYIRNKVCSNLLIMVLQN
jgi:hypothetical protein